MKLLPVLFLIFSFSAFAGSDYDHEGYGGYGISPQNQYKIDTAIHNERVRRENFEASEYGIGPTPSYKSRNYEAEIDAHREMLDRSIRR